MKRVKIFAISLLITFALGQSGCYGPFKLTTKLHDWNSQVGDRYINALVFFGFIVIPVYQVAAVLDAVIFNTIEFWSGENPISMKEGEQEIKMVQSKDRTYRVTATQNQYRVEIIAGKDQGERIDFIFNPDDKTWSMIHKEQAHKLLEMDEKQNQVSLFDQAGNATVFSMNENNPEAIRKKFNADLLMARQ